MPLPATVASPVLITDAAARYLGVCRSLLDDDRRSGRLGVPYVRIGDRIVYRVSDLDAWLAAQVSIPSRNVRQPAAARKPRTPGALPGVGRPTKVEVQAAADAGLSIKEYRAQQAQGGAA